MKLALTDPPVSSKDENEPKEEFASIVALVLYAANQANDIKNIVSKLEHREADLLMGVIYRLMKIGSANPQFSSNVLFRWHKALLEAFGQGVIIRHMTSREWI